MTSVFGPQRNVVAILTDFGSGSFYAGVMKAAMTAVDARPLLVDVTHSIPAHCIASGSYILSLVFEFFPERTVFLAVVDPGVGGPRKNLFVESKGRWVVAPDNGVVTDLDRDHGISGAFEIAPQAVERLRRHPPRGRTFLGRDVLGPVAVALAAGMPASRMGRPIKDVERISLADVVVRPRLLEGRGRYVDHFGNILTDISMRHLDEAFADVRLSDVEATIDDTTCLNGIADTFSNVRSGEPVALVNSWGRIEVAVRDARAADRFPRAARVRLALRSMEK